MERLGWRRMMLFVLAAVSAAGQAGCTEDKSKAIAASKISYDLGVNYMGTNQYQLALEQLLKSIRENPDFADSHAALGNIYFVMREFAKSEEQYKLAISLKNDFAEAQNNLGRLYFEQGQYDKAIELFRKALSNMLYRTPQLARHNLAWALYKKGEVKEALDQLKKAVTMDLKFCLAHRSMGIMQYEQGEALESVRAFDKFRESCPAEPEGPYRLAQAKRKFRLASTEEVMADLEKSLDLNQGYCPSRLMLGEIQDEIGRQKDALETMERYFDSCHEGADAPAYRLLGTLYLKAGQEAKGGAYLSVCAKRWPETAAGQACRQMLPK